MLNAEPEIFAPKEKYPCGYKRFRVAAGRNCNVTLIGKPVSI